MSASTCADRRHRRARAGEPAQDRALRPVVDDRDPHAAALGVDGTARAWRRRRPAPRPPSPPSHRGRSRRPVADRRPHRAPVAQVQDERARVDPVERDHAVLAQPVRPCRALRLAHDDALHVDAAGLRAALADAVVADHRRREAEDLLRVARVGDELLVAGHRGREDGLAEGDALGADRLGRGRRFRPRVRGSPVIARRTRTRPCGDGQPHLPASVSPSSHEFLGARAEAALADAPGRLGVEQDEVRAARRPRSAAARARTRAPARPTSARAASAAAAAPARRGACSATAKAVSSPVTPNGASSNGTSFSCRAWGAWSVAMTEIVPSRTASTSALRSSAARSGGFIFRFGSSERDGLVGQHEVVRRRLAGRPHARRAARCRSSSTDSRAERCSRWIGCPSYAASARSRPTITLSATDG